MAIIVKKPIPSVIKVGPYDYFVHIDPSECARMGVGQDHPNWGRHEGSTQQIYIAPGRTASHEKTILWHELLHALLWTYEMRPEDADEEEAIVRQLAPALVTLFNANPALIEYLREP